MTNLPNDRMRPRTGTRRPGRLLALAALPAALVLASCGGGGSSSAGGAPGATAPAATDAQCGQVPVVAPNDPDGLIATMPDDIQAAFNGWPTAVQASAWADAGGTDGPVTVGWLQQDSGSPTAAALKTTLTQLSADAIDAGEVAEFLVETPGGTGGQVTAADQVRAYEQLVRKGADVIIAQPLSGEALVAAVNSAGEQGIPTVTFTGYVDSPYSIDITPNPFDGVAQAVAKGVGMIGGEGSAMIVQGIEGMTVNTSSVTAAEQTFALCEGIEVVGTPAGNFNDPGAKSAVVSFLASHPGEIDIVYQVASMGAGVFAGFADAGRAPMPLVVDNLPTAASLAWWEQLRADGYDGLAVPGTAAQFGQTMWEVAMRTVRGEGPKVNQIALQVQFVTDDNLDQYLVDGATTTTNAETATVGSLAPTEYLDGYFTNPGAYDPR
ncbi:substrate-binding domain-containing protein [Mycobacterium sp.]|uniref:substrate-binding domain-containing protein n=1 Tax=Mycobacterium sp. TaxID=1785 RepID=UPI003A840061